MSKPTFNWSNTFNSDHKTWWLISNALEAASLAGYPYLEWNGRIYSVVDHVQLGKLVEVGLASEMEDYAKT